MNQSKPQRSAKTKAESDHRHCSLFPSDPGAHPRRTSGDSLQVAALPWESVLGSCFPTSSQQVSTAQPTRSWLQAAERASVEQFSTPIPTQQGDCSRQNLAQNIFQLVFQLSFASAETTGEGFSSGAAGLLENEHHC